MLVSCISFYGRPFKWKKNYREVDLKIQRQTFLFTKRLTPLPLVLITISPNIIRKDILQSMSH